MGNIMLTFMCLTDCPQSKVLPHNVFHLFSYSGIKILKKSTTKDLGLIQIFMQEPLDESIS